MASQCRAKNPATCKNHGVPLNSTNPTNDDARKSDFFGASVWNKVVSMQARNKTSGEVRDSLKNAFRDVEGFSEKNGAGNESSRKFIIGLLTKPELGTVEQEGKSSAAVTGIRENLRGHYETTADGGPSALATVRLFRALGRSDELGKDIRDAAWEQAQNPAAGASFEAKAEAMVSVLNKHKVFGDSEGKWLDSELRSLTGMIRNQATGNDSHNSLELTYRGSNVRLWVDAKVVDKEVTITGFKATDHPTKNSRMDYDGLNNDLAAVFYGKG
jgi:hypothetical protein